MLTLCIWGHMDEGEQCQTGTVPGRASLAKGTAGAKMSYSQTSGWAKPDSQKSQEVMSPASWWVAWEESELLQRSGLAGDRGQVGVTCSAKHGIRCPLTGSRCWPAVHPTLKPDFLRGLCADPHELLPSDRFL